MANTNNPFGFHSFGHRDGSAPTMGLERLFINSSDTNPFFTGDLVVRSGSGGTIAPTAGSTSAQLPCGVFVGCEYFNPTVSRVVWSSYFPGSVSSSSPVNAYVITDPEMQFIVQCSSGPITSTMIGANAIVTVAQSSLGNTTTGISAMVLSTAVTGSASYPFKIVDLYSNFAPPGVNGGDNATPFNIVVVTANSWDRRAGTTGLST